MHMHANERYGGSRLMMCGATLKSVCRQCGKTFLHTSMHAYRGCCTYGCMREMDRKNEKTKQPRGWTREKIEKRVEKCRERMAHFRAIAEDPETACTRKKSAAHSYRCWMAELGTCSGFWSQ